MLIQSCTALPSLVIGSAAGLACLLASAECVAAPHQLECSVTMRYDSHEQRSETRVIKFIYEDREGTLYYVDDGGQKARCTNSAVGTVEIMGSCGSESVWISRTAYQFELNSFESRWNPRRHIHEETWAYGEKGFCKEIEVPQQ
jgi:hypothetical protein